MKCFGVLYIGIYFLLLKKGYSWYVCWKYFRNAHQRCWKRVSARSSKNKPTNQHSGIMLLTANSKLLGTEAFSEQNIALPSQCKVTFSLLLSLCKADIPHQSLSVVKCIPHCFPAWSSISSFLFLFKICATCHVMAHVVQRDSSAIKFDRVWNRIYFSFILLAGPLNRWRRGGNRSTRRKSLMTSFRKCHILKLEDSSPKRDWNPRNSIDGRLEKQTCYPLHGLLPKIWGLLSSVPAWILPETRKLVLSWLHFEMIGVIGSVQGLVDQLSI